MGIEDYRGGSAFPRYGKDQIGMMMDEYFAAAALTGVLEKTMFNDEPSVIAKRCWDIALAMIEEGRKRK